MGESAEIAKEDGRKDRGTPAKTGGERRAGEDPAAGSAGAGTGAGSSEPSGSVSAASGSGSSKAPKEKGTVILAVTPDKKETKKETQKPKNTKKKKEQDPVIGSGEIQSLLIAVFGIIASRPGMEIWTLSEAEAKTVADPLAVILKENELLEKAGINGNYILLFMASAGILIPRIVFSFQQAKKAEVNDEQGRAITEPDKKSDGTASRISGSDRSSIFDSLSPTA